MYQSKKTLSYKTTSENKQRVLEYIKSHPLRRCGYLKRNVNISLFYDANKHREDASIRFSSFFVGIEILKSSKNITNILKNGFKCYEILGLCKNKNLVMVHLREEITKTGKQLFLISTFYKK